MKHHKGRCVGVVEPAGQRLRYEPAEDVSGVLGQGGRWSANLMPGFVGGVFDVSL